MKRKQKTSHKDATKQRRRVNTDSAWNDAAAALERANEQATDALQRLSLSIPQQLKPLLAQFTRDGYPAEEVLQQLALIHPSRGAGDRAAGPSAGRLSDCGLAILLAMPNGRLASTLDFRFTAISDEGLQMLASGTHRWRTVTTLVLTGTNVTDAGLKALAEARVPFKMLTSLILDSTSVSDKGVRLLFSKRSALLSLKTLSVSGTGVSSGCAQTLMRKIPAISIQTERRRLSSRSAGFVY